MKGIGSDVPAPLPRKSRRDSVSNLDSRKNEGILLKLQWMKWRILYGELLPHAPEWTAKPLKRVAKEDFDRLVLNSNDAFVLNLTHRLLLVSFQQAAKRGEAPLDDQGDGARAPGPGGGGRARVADGAAHPDRAPPEGGDPHPPLAVTGPAEKPGQPPGRGPQIAEGFPGRKAAEPATAQRTGGASHSGSGGSGDRGLPTETTLDVIVTSSIWLVINRVNRGRRPPVQKRRLQESDCKVKEELEERWLSIVVNWWLTPSQRWASVIVVPCASNELR